MPSATATRPNLLKSGDVRPFQGEQRSKALVTLASAIAEQRTVSVMQLVNRDPSLAMETLEIPVRGATGAQKTRMEFPLACLKYGLSAGYVFAIGSGFPVDRPVDGGRTTLLETAMSMAGQRNVEADLSLLLSMGADPAAVQSSDALYTVMASAFPSKSDDHRPGAVRMLLDAKASFDFPPGFACPYSVLVQTGGWGVPEKALAMTVLMSRFAKAGIDPNRRCGAPAQTPLMRAIGAKNEQAIIAVVRIGAKTGPEQLNGSDLFDLLKAQRMEKLVPEVQAALMEAHISAAGRLHAASGAQADTVAADAPARRRRVGMV